MSVTLNQEDACENRYLMKLLWSRESGYKRMHRLETDRAENQAVRPAATVPAI